MADIACQPRKWLSSIIDHASDRRTSCGHRAEILWDDTVGGPYGIMCLGCGIRFTLDGSELRRLPGSDVDLLRVGLQTFKGKEALLDALQKQIAKNRALPSKSSWDKVLSDDFLV